MSQAVLNAPDFGSVRLAIGRLLYWRYRLFVQRKQASAVLEKVCGMQLLILPGVLNPRWMRTGAFFASQLTSELLEGAQNVLDMGSGSGICAVAAAKLVRSVVAVDISPQAVRCTQVNTLLNRVEDRVEVLRGDLFEPLGGRRFDVVLFNPPFLRRAPRDDADRAWASTDVAERFAAALGQHLNPAGKAFLLLSSFGDAEAFLRELRRQPVDISIHCEREFVNEKLVVFKIVPAQRLS